MYRPDGRGRYPTQLRVIGGQHFASLSVGDNSCGITIGSQVLCWGDHSLGKLGTGSTVRRVSERRHSSAAALAPMRAFSSTTAAFRRRPARFARFIRDVRNLVLNAA